MHRLPADADWMAVAIALSRRGGPASAPNPNVGCLLVKHGKVIARGWTQPGGRPPAEAMALAAGGEAARGATAYVSLEHCPHASPRGPACSESLNAAGDRKRVVEGRRVEGGGRLGGGGINKK